MGQIAVEYSPDQKCYHLSTLWEVLRNNAIAAKMGVNPGFLLLGVFDTDEEAAAFIETRKKLEGKRNEME